MASEKKPDLNHIIDKYVEWVLEHGKEPSSIYTFCKKLGIKENDFYDQLGSFQSIQTKLWLKFHQDTLTALEEDSTYPDYDAQQKILAYLYTFFTALKTKRSYLLAIYKNTQKKLENASSLNQFQEEFEKWMNARVEEGLEEKKFHQRQFIDKYYHRAFWPELLFLIHFWLNDESVGFERTDQAIEKASSLILELFKQNPIDQAFELGKLLLQRR